MATNNANKHDMVKNPNCQEADQLAIYRHGWGVELGYTQKQLQLSGQRGTWICDHQISRPAPEFALSSTLSGSSSSSILFFPSFFACFFFSLSWNRKCERSRHFLYQQNHIIYHVTKVHLCKDEQMNVVIIMENKTTINTGHIFKSSFSTCMMFQE